MKQLAEFKPWFIEEPTSPDDVLGHAAIRKALAPLGIGVATGEMCQNRVMFKQFMQAGAIDVCQVDACRLGGLQRGHRRARCWRPSSACRWSRTAAASELPEYTQHLSTIDYVGRDGEGRACWSTSDNLHEHFLHPERGQGRSTSSRRWRRGTASR